ncbi:hypothetical protein ACLB2K_032014 [Fragaria x ananassa]
MSSLKVDCSLACNRCEPNVATMINPAHPTYGWDPYVGHGYGGMPTGLRAREVINHGMSEILLNDTMGVFNEFFELPPEEKTTINDLMTPANFAGSIQAV